MSASTSAAICSAAGEQVILRLPLPSPVASRDQRQRGPLIAVRARNTSPSARNTPRALADAFFNM